MYDEFKLSGAQRGYKQPGKKLLPRDSQVAAACGHMKCSKREYMRGVAAETAHYGKQYPAEAHERKFDKAFAALNVRQRKVFERMVELGHAPLAGQRRMCRAFDAMTEYDQIERCIAAEDAMWANAK